MSLEFNLVKAWAWKVFLKAVGAAGRGDVQEVRRRAAKLGELRRDVGDAAVREWIYLLWVTARRLIDWTKKYTAETAGR